MKISENVLFEEIMKGRNYWRRIKEIKKARQIEREKDKKRKNEKNNNKKHGQTQVRMN